MADVIQQFDEFGDEIWKEDGSYMGLLHIRSSVTCINFTYNVMLPWVALYYIVTVILIFVLSGRHVKT